ncbi:TPA: fimbrial protein [Serratia fonticola]
MTRTMTALLLTSALMGVVCTAQAENGEAKMNFHGTLRDPPLCTITDSNDGSQIDVNFGEQVGISKVDGENYRQRLGYKIECDKAVGGSWALTLSLDGTPAGFNPDLLATEQPDLGIRIYLGDKTFVPGSSLEKIDSHTPPELWAVPVKRPGATLDEGYFEAWATLRAEYH